MTKYNWVSNIKMNIFMLRVVGLWPKGDDTYTPGPYMVYVTILLTVFLIGHTFFQFVNIYFVRNDLAAVTGTVYILLIEVMAIFKVYYLIRNMKMLKELLKVLDTDMFQPKNSVQISAIARNIWFWKVIYNLFLYTSIGANLGWAIVPLMSEGKKLPFIAWYPFDTTVSPFYQITYIYQLCGIYLIAIAQVNIDGLVAALNVFNGSQFDILCDNLRNLHQLGENILSNLLNCIKHHKEILKYSERSNKFLNWILLVQFFVSTVSIGITMFQLSLVVPMSSDFFMLVFYEIAITAQIFMYCWFGNEVEEKSSNISYALFECDWTSFSKDVKKIIVFFSLRAQTPVKLSALNLFYLSLDTFMRILKTSWSYFALLHQVSSRK